MLERISCERQTDDEMMGRWHQTPARDFIPSFFFSINLNQNALLCLLLRKFYLLLKGNRDVYVWTLPSSVGVWVRMPSYEEST